MFVRFLSLSQSITRHNSQSRIGWEFPLLCRLQYGNWRMGKERLTCIQHNRAASRNVGNIKRRAEMEAISCKHFLQVRAVVVWHENSLRWAAYKNGLANTQIMRYQVYQQMQWSVGIWRLLKIRWIYEPRMEKYAYVVHWMRKSTAQLKYKRKNILY
jgi:hypothetical protein